MTRIVPVPANPRSLRVIFQVISHKHVALILWGYCRFQLSVDRREVLELAYSRLGQNIIFLAEEETT